MNLVSSFQRSSFLVPGPIDNTLVSRELNRLVFFIHVPAAVPLFCVARLENVVQCSAR